MSEHRCPECCQRVVEFWYGGWKYVCGSTWNELQERLVQTDLCREESNMEGITCLLCGSLVVREQEPQGGASASVFYECGTYSPDGGLGSGWVQSNRCRELAREAACVNACKDMKDPVEEVRRLREAANLFIYNIDAVRKHGGLVSAGLHIVYAKFKAALGDKP